MDTPCVCVWCGRLMFAYSAGYAKDPVRCCERDACQVLLEAWYLKDEARVGIGVHERLANANGMAFTLFYGPDVAPAALVAEETRLRRQRDVVGRVTRVCLPVPIADVRPAHGHT